MTSTFLRMSTRLAPKRRSAEARRRRAGAPPGASESQPLLLSRHVVLRHLLQLPPLHHVDRRLRRRAVIGGRVRDRRSEAAEIEVLELLERRLHAGAIEGVRLVGPLERFAPDED